MELTCFCILFLSSMKCSHFKCWCETETWQNLNCDTCNKYIFPSVTHTAPPVTPPLVLFPSGWWHGQGYADEHKRSVGGGGERTARPLPIHPRQNHRPPESGWLWLTSHWSLLPVSTCYPNLLADAPFSRHCHRGYVLACLGLYHDCGPARCQPSQGLLTVYSFGQRIQTRKTWPHFPPVPFPVSWFQAGQCFFALVSFSFPDHWASVCVCVYVCVYVYVHVCRSVFTIDIYHITSHVCFVFLFDLWVFVMFEVLGTLESVGVRLLSWCWDVWTWTRESTEAMRS